MILLCGIPTEAPVQMMRSALDGLGLEYVIFNQRDFARSRAVFQIAGGVATGTLTLQDRSYPLQDFTGVYNRLMDDQSLPEVRSLTAADALRTHCRALHDVLIQWMEVAPARVVNRVGAMGSNCSKPFQMQLIARLGFAVPETLITNQPDLVRAFQRQHGQVIYKSISSVRSIVRLLQPEDDPRLEHIRWCPTQFQAYVPGDDVRVHVVGDQVFAVRIKSGAIDYRYAARQGSSTDLEPIELDEALRRRCIELAEALALPFAGIDLKFAPDGNVYCFEVNPSPAFSYYESATGLPIAAAVARYLAGG